ncbi:hypothetical protein G7046_g3116 [Stylonectria norvegica]|nr:hypothetical protein G7046_g3116 [Stylonectria norvegica]
MAKGWSPYSDIPDLTGKVAVVTGANSGIGLQTTKHLVSRGAKVYFTTRSESKAKTTKDHIRSIHPDVPENGLIWLPLDLGKIKSVNSAIAELKAKETKIDILVNNAGMVPEDMKLNEGGWETCMAICHVGHFVFTNGILSLLKEAAKDKNADVRIVTVSSNVTYIMIPPDYPLDFTSTAFLTGSLPYIPWKWRYFQSAFFTVDMVRYAMAKLANALFAKELQRRLDEQGVPIISISLNPGGVLSDDGLTIFSGFIKPLMRRVLVSPDQGSFNSLFAATAKDIRDKSELYKGQYIEPIGQVHASHPVLKNDKQVRAAWDTTTTEVNKYLNSQGLSPLSDW